MQGYRQPIMKEKSSVQDLLVAPSRFNKQKLHRRSHSVIQDVDVVVFGDRKLSQPSVAAPEGVQKWAGVNIPLEGGLSSKTRFRKKND